MCADGIALIDSSCGGDMSAAARRLRALPDEPRMDRGFDNSLHARHAELLQEKGQWAGKMQRLIRDHAEEIKERDQDYVMLVDRCLTAEAKVRAFTAIFSSVKDYPALRGMGES